MPTKEELAEFLRSISGGKTIDIERLTKSECTYLLALYLLSNYEERTKENSENEQTASED